MRMCRACRAREKREAKLLVTAALCVAKYISLLIKHTWNNQPPPCSRHIKENWTWILYLRYACAACFFMQKERESMYVCVCMCALACFCQESVLRAHIHMRKIMSRARVDYANRRFVESVRRPLTRRRNSISTTHQKSARLEWKRGFLYFCFSFRCCWTKW